MSIEKLTGVHEVQFPKALVNGFLVIADVPTIIDTGTPGAAGKLLAAAEKAGLQPRDIQRIIVTHRHADHAGNAGELARATGAGVHVPAAEERYFAGGVEQPKPQPVTPLGQALVPYVKVALPWALDRVEVQPTLADGAMIGPFQVVATPGHTDGHVSLLWPERGILFTGDAAANITRVGQHPAADDPEQARRSFERLAGLEFEAACFGHGRTITGKARAAFA